LQKELTGLIRMPMDPSESQTAPADSTTELTRRWRSGDPLAFEKLVDRYTGPLLSYVLSKVHHLQDGEDVVQETLIRAHRSVRGLRDVNRCWLWLKQIAHNAAMDSLKRAQRWGIPASPQEIQEMQERSVKQNAVRHANLEMQEVVEAIEALPETYRLAAIYYYLEEWPYQKIAEALGIDTAAARQRISRANKMLRESLKSGK